MALFSKAISLILNVGNFYILGIFAIVIMDKITGQHHLTNPFFILLSVWVAGINSVIGVGYFIKKEMGW